MSSAANAMPTLLLARGDVAAVLDLDACIAAVEDAFRAHAGGGALGPASLSVLTQGGGFHVKAAGLARAPARFAAKTNANFPGNPARLGLPTIQGVIVLCDGGNGRLLAVMDSIEITIQRTAAATAVAARYLARSDSRLATLCGCGAQAAAQLRAVARVLPLERVLTFDIDPARAASLATELSASGLKAEPAASLDAALATSDVVITCSPSKLPYLGPEKVRPGTFIAAVGADSPAKSEIEPALMAAATVVVDLLDQCAEYGDLHHAIEACVMTRADVHAELADVVAGRRPGRRRADEITLFDSTGTALQDLAAATLVYDRARSAGRGRTLDFAQ